MNAFILYIEDNGDHNLSVSAEVIGEPCNSLIMGQMLMSSLANHPNVKMLRSSVFTQEAAGEDAH